VHRGHCRCGRFAGQQPLQAFSLQCRAVSCTCTRARLCSEEPFVDIITLGSGWDLPPTALGSASSTHWPISAPALDVDFLVLPAIVPGSRRSPLQVVRATLPCMAWRHCTCTSHLFAERTSPLCEVTGQELSSLTSHYLRDRSSERRKEIKPAAPSLCNSSPTSSSTHAFHKPSIFFPTHLLFPASA
jgi:hypothetical protein